MSSSSDAQSSDDQPACIDLWTRVVQSPVVCKCVDRFLTFAGIGCWACCSKDCPTMSVAARQRDVAGFLPLQLALALRAPETVIHALLNVHPKAAGQVLRGITTLHLAAGFYKELYQRHYLGFKRRVTDASDEQTPQHKRRFACAYGKQNLSVVSLLMEMHPWMVRARDQSGMLPLHAALICGAPDEVVLELLKADGKTSTAPCKIKHALSLYGLSLFPVHFAILFGYSEDVFLALLTENPDVQRHPHSVSLAPDGATKCDIKQCSLADHADRIQGALNKRKRAVDENGFRDFAEYMIKHGDSFN